MVVLRLKEVVLRLEVVKVGAGINLLLTVEFPLRLHTRTHSVEGIRQNCLGIQKVLHTPLSGREFLE